MVILGVLNLHDFYNSEGDQLQTAFRNNREVCEFTIHK